MRLADRLADRWGLRQRYWEGEASGAAVMLPSFAGPDPNREIVNATGLVEQAQQAYRSNGVVFAVMLARGMLLSEATFKLREKTTKKLYGTGDVLRGRRVDLSILETPWPNGTSSDLWTRLDQDASHAGSGFYWKAEPDRIVRLPPREVVIVSEEETNGNGNTYRSVIGYDWDPARNQPGVQNRQQAQFFPVDEVAHYAPIPDPVANFRGMSWLTPILRDVFADNQMLTYKTQYLDHGTPITAVKYPLKMKPETIDSIVARLVEKFGGTANAFRPLVLDQGADPILGGGLKELDYAAIQAVGEERICAAAGVPPAIVGLKSAEDNSTYQMEMRRFADLYARPTWRATCAALQKLVPNVPADVELWFDTSDIAALQAAETERAQVNQVNAAALLTLTQSGFTRKSAIAYIASGDVSLLVPDPNAPTPGVQERETVGIKGGATPVTGPDSGGDANSTTVSTPRPAVLGNPPGGGQVLTKQQTAASKKPMPASIPTSPSSNGRH